MPSWIAEFIRLAQPADGRVPPAFGPHHAAVALMMIGRQQPLGRYELCESMSVGEGSARTLLKRLSEANYITADGKQGQRLTEKGTGLFESMEKDIPRSLFLDLPNLSIYSKSYANLVRNKRSVVKDGIRQRDEAIIQGGYGKAGATTVIQRDGSLLMPPDDFNILLEYEAEAILMMDALRPEDDDVIIIGSADDGNLAREVSMAAVMTLFTGD